MKKHVYLTLWKLAAATAFGLGVIGVVVPGLPTVPFMILAAWAASKGWPKFEAWLLNHARYGQHIRNWREHRTIPRRAKIYATGMMLISTLMLIAAELNPWLLASILFVMASTLIWMWFRVS